MEEEIEKYLFKIKYDNLWDIYKEQEKVLWHVEELDLHKDKTDFQDLTLDERAFLKYVLTFFVVGDIIVGEMITERLLDSTITEIRLFYALQSYVENIHFEVYSLILSSLIEGEDTRIELMKTTCNDTAMKKKIDWMNEYIKNDNISKEERILALAAVEGIFFSGAFAAIFWLKDKGIMHGLTHANELISRDESLHCQFACEVLKTDICKKLDENLIQKVIRSAVDIEVEFYECCIQNRMRKMNKDLMIKYIQFVADNLYRCLTGKEIYKVKNPFSFMSLSTCDSKTNFIELEVSEYIQKAESF